MTGEGVDRTLQHGYRRRVVRRLWRGSATRWRVPTPAGPYTADKATSAAHRRSMRVRIHGLKTRASASGSVRDQGGASPRRAHVLRPVTDGNCAAARPGGEQPEVNDQSATQVTSIRLACFGEPAGMGRSPDLGASPRGSDALTGNVQKRRRGTWLEAEWREVLVREPEEPGRASDGVHAGSRPHPERSRRAEEPPARSHQRP